MNEFDWQQLYQTAKQWTLEAGRRLRETIHDTYQIEYKTSTADLVTEKDREIEAFFVNRIQDAFPQHKILGEEGISASIDDVKKGIVWIIDPIDGTTNFVHQKRNFSISVGIYEDGKPKIGIIYDPIQEECFHACHNQGAYLNEQQLAPLQPTSVTESVMGINSLWLIPNKRYDHQRLQSLVRYARGTRSLGSAALEIASVACGRLDAYLTLRLSPWDYAAGLVILGELGAKMTTIHNESIDLVAPTSSVFVSRPGLHEDISRRFLLTQE